MLIPVSSTGSLGGVQGFPEGKGIAKGPALEPSFGEILMSKRGKHPHHAASVLKTPPRFVLSVLLLF